MKKVSGCVRKTIREVCFLNKKTDFYFCLFYLKIWRNILPVMPPKPAAKPPTNEVKVSKLVEDIVKTSAILLLNMAAVRKSINSA